MKHITFALSLCLGTASPILAQTPAPQAGTYIGTLRVTKVHAQDGLSSTYTLRAQARVFADGTMSIATTARESPLAASNTESTLDRATPLPPPTGPIDDPLLILARLDPVTLTTTTANYLVNAKYRAELVVSQNLLRLTYSNPVAGYRINEAFIPHPDIPGSGGEITRLQPSPQFTVFRYSLRKER